MTNDSPAQAKEFDVLELLQTVRFATNQDKLAVVNHLLADISASDQRYDYRLSVLPRGDALVAPGAVRPVGGPSRPNRGGTARASGRGRGQSQKKVSQDPGKPSRALPNSGMQVDAPSGSPTVQNPERKRNPPNPKEYKGPTYSISKENLGKLSQEKRDLVLSYLDRLRARYFDEEQRITPLLINDGSGKPLAARSSALMELLRSRLFKIEEQLRSRQVIQPNAVITQDEALIYVPLGIAWTIMLRVSNQNRLDLTSLEDYCRGTVGQVVVSARSDIVQFHKLDRSVLRGMFVAYCKVRSELSMSAANDFVMPPSLDGFVCTDENGLTGCIESSIDASLLAWEGDDLRA